MFEKWNRQTLHTYRRGHPPCTIYNITNNIAIVCYIELGDLDHPFTEVLSEWAHQGGEYHECYYVIHCEIGAAVAWARPAGWTMNVLLQNVQQLTLENIN